MKNDRDWFLNTFYGQWNVFIVSKNYVEISAIVF